MVNAFVPTVFLRVIQQWIVAMPRDQMLPVWRRHAPNVR